MRTCAYRRHATHHSRKHAGVSDCSCSSSMRAVPFRAGLLIGWASLSHNCNVHDGNVWWEQPAFRTIVCCCVLPTLATAHLAPHTRSHGGNAHSQVCSLAPIASTCMATQSRTSSRDRCGRNATTNTVSSTSSGASITVMPTTVDERDGVPAQVEEYARKGYTVYREWATPAETAAATIQALTTAMTKPKGVLVSGTSCSPPLHTS